MSSQGSTFAADRSSSRESYGMILDIFSELQRPGAVTPTDFRDAYDEALAQAVLADELGFGCWWAVEHHGTPVFSLSSTPEMMLVAIAQKTQGIRLGHAAVLAPFRINHPLRVAERAAFLDLVSDGRVELGLARAGGSEWETFGVDPDRSRAELSEAFHMIPRMWREDSFKWESELIRIPERRVVPKPMQDPHPPLWATAASQEGFEHAGRMGVGVLGTGFMTPLDVSASMFEAYDRGLEDCEPAAAFVNAQRALFTFFHCGESRRQVIESGAPEAVLWFMNEAPRVFGNSRQLWLDLIRGEAWNHAGVDLARAVNEAEGMDDLDDPHPVVRLLNRHEAGLPIDPEEAYDALEAIDGVILGDVDLCRKKLRRHGELNIDRLGLFTQFGALGHEAVMRSMRIAGEELLPEFQGGG